MRNGALMFKSDVFRKARRKFASLAFAVRKGWNLDSICLNLVATVVQL